MKYCSNCGNQINDNLAFCPNCGANLNSLNQNTFSSNQNLYQETSNVSEQFDYNDNYVNKNNNSFQNETSNNKNVIVIIIIAIIVIAGAIIGIVTIFNNKVENQIRNNTLEKSDIKTGTNSKEQALCKTIIPYIDSYNLKSLSFDQLLTKLENVHKSSCIGENNSICTSIDSIVKYFSNLNLELEDCNKQKYKESFKEACEASNKLKISMRERLSESQQAQVNVLDRNCSNFMNN